MDNNDCVGSVTNLLSSVVPDQSSDDTADQATNDCTNGGKRPRDSEVRTRVRSPESLAFCVFLVCLLIDVAIGV